MSEELVNLEINGLALQAPRGEMLIRVADEAGIRIPRFCYHKKLSVAANCRMCLVEVEKAPKPLPACATPVVEGMKVYTHSSLAQDAQKAVMEFLLINHPLDCPICDQGGECELQDVAMGFGGDVSRFQERKRVVKDKDIGPLIATDMTRCIHCTRCVRFGDEVAGVRELGATDRGEQMEIGTFIERSVDSELSGNVIDLCPVGALTSKPFRFRARAWEMASRASIAPHDCVGSNLNLHFQGRRVLRVVPRENETVNETWISDRDRFSYQGLYSDDRLQVPMIKRNDRWQEVDWETALRFATTGLRNLTGAQDPPPIGALVSPNVTLEEGYLIQKLMRGLGSSNIDHRLREADFSDQDHAPLFPWLGQSLSDLETVDAALLVGANCRKEQPLINHRLRKAVLNGAKVVAINSVDFPFNYPLAEKIIVHPPGVIGALSGIARGLSAQMEGADQQLTALLGDIQPNAQQNAIVKMLLGAERATVLLGPSAMEHPQAGVLRGLAGLIAQLSGATFGYLPTGANSAGAWLSGLLPHRGPAGVTIDRVGLDAQAMFEQMLEGYLLVGIEPELDCAHSLRAQQALRQSLFTVNLTAYRTPFMEEYAHVLLPIAPFAETDGTFVNVAGRRQSFQAAVPPLGDSRPAWKVLRVMGNLLGLDGFEYQSLDAVRTELSQKIDGTSPNNMGAWCVPSELPQTDVGSLWRVGDVPIYAVDPIVRRAPALQQTEDAVKAACRMRSEQAELLGLGEGDEVWVSQEGGEKALRVVFDERVAAGCVHIQSGLAESVGLGASFGPVSLEQSE